jgi:drug/metabolite transporter (DMT)-like permease
MHRYTPYLAGLGFASIFGFSFMFTRGALEHIQPFHLLGLRFGTAVLAMAILRLSGLVTIRIKWSDYKALLPLAIFQPIIYFSTETTGVQLTSSSQAGMMIAVIPIFVTILAAIILREQPAPMQLPFILASVGGVFFIMAMQTQNGSGASTLGSMLLMGAVMAAACYNIASRYASQTYSPLQTTWVMMVVGAVTFNTVAVAQSLATGSISQYFLPLPLVWPAVAYLGILSSVLAFFLINFSLSKLTAIQSSVFANLVTVIAIAAGVIFRGEPFHWFHAVGTAAILAGVYGTNRFARATIAQLNEAA